jgi:transposase-like protein
MSSTGLRYSEAFKLQIVKELKSGELSCINAARLKYGVGGFRTIRGWLNQYGRNGLIPKTAKIEMPEENSKIKKLK